MLDLMSASSSKFTFMHSLHFAYNYRLYCEKCFFQLYIFPKIVLFELLKTLFFIIYFADDLCSYISIVTIQK